MRADTEIQILQKEKLEYIKKKNYLLNEFSRFTSSDLCEIQRENDKPTTLRVQQKTWTNAENDVVSTIVDENDCG